MAGQFTFPHFKAKLAAVQPDYAKWRQVRVGMDRDEVIALLGEPLVDRYRGGKPRRDDPWYGYGFLELPMAPHPRTYSFLVGFNDQGKVFAQSDPFDGVFSTNGKPTRPRIIIPLEGSRFAHYPRVVDIRWFPASGEYPIRYSVEVAHGDPNGEWWSDGEEYATDLDMPFFTCEFAGSSPGRLRVKAHNALGESEWSDWRHFTFWPPTD